MKKKIINGLLMMALTVASTSSFVSCTDTVSDDTAALKEMLANQDTRLTAALNQQIALLKQQITDLQTELQNSKCKCEIPFLQEYLDLLNRLDEELGDISNAISGTGGGSGSGMNLATWIAQVNTKLQELQAKDQELEGKIATNTANITSLLTQVETLNSALQGLEGRVAANEANIATLQACCQTVNGIISTLQTDLADLKTKVVVLENNYTSLNDERIKALESYKIVVDQRLTQISDSLATAYQKINDAETRLANIEENFATKQALADSTDSLRKEIDEVWEATAGYLVQLFLNDQTLDAKIEAQSVTIGQMQQAIQDLQAKDQELEGKITSLETRVANLETRVAKNEEDINKIFNALNKQVTGIIVQGAYSPAFGIGMLPIDAKTNILAAYVGKSTKAIEFPAMDATNYVNQSDFWTNEEAEIVDFSDVYAIGADQVLLSDADDNAGKLYLTVNPSQVDFEGKIITLENSQGKAAPIELAPLKKSDYRLAFGWTRGAQNGFYEADAKISKKNLQDAKARIDKNALIDAAKGLYHNHNMASLREAAQTIITSNGDILDAQAAKATYDGLDADGNIEEKTTFSEYSVATTIVTPLSYNTLKGWNPTSIPGVNKVENFVNNIINKINVEIDLGIKKITVPEIKTINIVELSDDLKAKFKFEMTAYIDTAISKSTDPVVITIPSISGSTTATSTTVESITVYDNLNNPIGHTNEQTITIPATAFATAAKTTTLPEIPIHMHMTVTVDMRNEVQELYDNLTTPMNDVNKMLTDLQKFMDDVNEMLGTIQNLDTKINGQIADMKNSIKNEIIGYIDRFEKKILSYASYVNQALQPVLLYKSVDGLNRVSTIEKGASQMTGTVALVPTNFNAELLSPAFKKYVVCTGAWDANGNFDAAAAKAANADSANENFAKVIDGQERLVTFTGKAGYKYRIVYQALDYHGMIASGRYYVQF